jgi:hypothetical protein
MTSPCYAEFYDGLPDTYHGEYASIYAGTAPAAITAPVLLSALAQATSTHVLAYLGQDGNIHVVHRLDQLRPNLTVPGGPNINGFFGIQDEINEFGGNVVQVTDAFLAAITVQNVPSAGDVEAAITAGPTLRQVTVANPQATSNVDTRYAVVVPPPYVAQILRHMATGTIAPTGFWNLAQHVVDHPVRSGSCLAFVDWCRVAVAGGIGATNPLRNAAGVPTFCCVDAALGHSRQAIRLQDFPQLSGAGSVSVNVDQRTGGSSPSTIVTTSAWSTVKVQKNAVAINEIFMLATFPKQ